MEQYKLSSMPIDSLIKNCNFTLQNSVYVGVTV